MLIIEEIPMRWNPRNKEWYISKCYTFTKHKDEFIIRSCDLSLNSKEYVRVQCDYCAEEQIETISTKTFQDYMNGRKDIHKDACDNCKYKKSREVSIHLYRVDHPLKSEQVKKKAIQKTIETNLERYGAEYHMLTDDFKESMKALNQERYGVDHYSQTDEYKEKYRQTSLDRFGTKHPLLSEEVRQKITETFLDRYGTDNPLKVEEIYNKGKDTMLSLYDVAYPLQSEEFLKKAQETNINRYGHTSPAKNEEVAKKTMETNMRKYGARSYLLTENFKAKYKAKMLADYGVDNPLKSQKVREKIKASFLKKFGVENPFGNKEVIAKIKQTNLLKYGVESPLQNKEILEKTIRTLSKNGTARTSSQQIAIFEMLQSEGYAVELNKPLSRATLDIALVIDNIQIDIEYDGSYWHIGREKEDRARDEFVKSEGWKVLRIRGGNKVPTLDQVKEKINVLLNTERKYDFIPLEY